MVQLSESVKVRTAQNCSYADLSWSVSGKKKFCSNEELSGSVEWKKCSKLFFCRTVFTSSVLQLFKNKVELPKKVKWLKYVCGY